jgi:asparagine synthase (glutamine-hydrolysing)
LDELVATHRSGHPSFYGTMLWVLVMLEEWLAAHEPTMPAGFA